MHALLVSVPEGDRIKIEKNKRYKYEVLLVQYERYPLSDDDVAVGNGYLP